MWHIEIIVEIWMKDLTKFVIRVIVPECKAQMCDEGSSNFHKYGCQLFKWQPAKYVDKLPFCDIIFITHKIIREAVTNLVWI